MGLSNNKGHHKQINRRIHNQLDIVTEQTVAVYCGTDNVLNLTDTEIRIFLGKYIPRISVPPAEPPFLKVRPLPNPAIIPPRIHAVNGSSIIGSVGTGVNCITADKNVEIIIDFNTGKITAVKIKGQNQPVKSQRIQRRSRQFRNTQSIIPYLNQFAKHFFEVLDYKIK